jgi:adenine/guanine phosphoribosyltransferase-like PRPP-binding protein
LKDIFASPTNLKEAVNRALEQLKGKRYDAIAVRGVSGAVVGSIVAARKNKQLIVVRKQNVISHAAYQVEGVPSKSFKYAIIDDFVSSGRTIANIVGQIERQSPDSKCIGIACYHNEHYKFIESEELYDFDYVKDTKAGCFNYS